MAAGLVRTFQGEASSCGTERKLCYQASVTEGTKVYHKNYSREEIIDYLEQAMEEFRQLQVIGRSQDGSILISKKGKATIKTKIIKLFRMKV